MRAGSVGEAEWDSNPNQPEDRDAIVTTMLVRIAIRPMARSLKAVPPRGRHASGTGTSNRSGNASRLPVNMGTACCYWNRTQPAGFWRSSDSILVPVTTWKCADRSTRRRAKRRER